MERQQLTTSHRQTDAQTVPKQKTSINPLFSILLLSKTIIWHGISLVSSGHLSGCASYTASVYSTREQSKKQRPWYCASTGQEQLKHWCVMSIVFVTNLKRSTIWATMKNINFIPARLSTHAYVIYHMIHASSKKWVTRDKINPHGFS